MESSRETSGSRADDRDVIAYLSRSARKTPKRRLGNIDFDQFDVRSIIPFGPGRRSSSGHPLQGQSAEQFAAGFSLRLLLDKELAC
jgi:hypothetical protein